MKIEYAIVADHAEISHNRLYLMGGGRDSFPVAKVPGGIRIAIAAGIRIEWAETNLRHPVHVTIEDDDGKEHVRIEAHVSVGRPAELTAGASQLAQLATAVQFKVEAYGGFRARVRAGEDGFETETIVPFRVAAPQKRQVARQG